MFIKVPVELINRLEQIKTAELVNFLEQVDPGRDPWGVGKLADELGRRKAQEAVPRLLEMLAIEGTQKMMTPIIRALGKIGDPTAVEPLIVALQQKGDASSDAAWALGYLGNGRAISPLIEALGYSKKWIRCSAAKALGRLGDEKAIEPLRGMLSDADEWVQKNAKEALVKLGDSDTPGVDEWILENVDSQQEGQRLVDLKLVNRETIKRMFSRGVSRLVSSTKKTITPATNQLVLKSAELVCGVCGDQFDLPDPLELCVRGPSDASSVYECNCPGCGSKNNLIGHTTKSSDVGQECWVIATLVSFHPKYQNSPYLGWPLLKSDKVFVKTRKQESANEAGNEKQTEVSSGSELSARTETEHQKPWWKFWSK